MSQTEKRKKQESPTISESLISRITQKLSDDQAVRENFGGDARISIDRPLPFLCVYRRPEGRPDPGTAHLILGEAAYLVADQKSADLPDLVRAVAKTLADKFGAFLIIEIWAGESAGNHPPGEYTTASEAAFKIWTDSAKAVPSTLETLQRSLAAFDFPHFESTVAVATGKGTAPPGMRPLLTVEEIRRLSCLVIGLETTPIYRDPETAELYLSTLRLFRRRLSKALQKTFFEFVHVQTPERPTHPEMLGRRVVVDAVWTADARLARLSDQFNYLMAVTPVNSDQAFEEFKKQKFRGEPVFHYRLLTIDPEELKRRLYQISFDEIEDPTMVYLLRDKRIELDRQITLIEDRNTPRFLYESQQLFPPVGERLLGLAEKILQLPGPGAAKRPKSGKKIGAAEIREMAEAEIAYYRKMYPEMTARVEIREDTPAGLMVAHGDLLIGHRSAITEARIDALLQHEIGTHSVTYFNGRAQPLKLLYSGLPGYEQLQEGLAVFAEYLVGGLSFARMRTLAARVVAVYRLTRGNTFAEVFEELRDRHGFSARAAFNITMRVFRGGGLTKDAVYLRGLVDVLEYLAGGGDINTLFVGKMGPEHVSIIRGLQWREVLRPAPLVPRYMNLPSATEKLEKARQGLSVLDLI